MVKGKGASGYKVVHELLFYAQITLDKSNLTPICYLFLLTVTHHCKPYKPVIKFQNHLLTFSQK